MTSGVTLPLQYAQYLSFYCYLDYLNMRHVSVATAVWRALVVSIALYSGHVSTVLECGWINYM